MSAVCTTSTLPSSPVLAQRPATVPPAVRRGAWQLGAGGTVAGRWARTGDDGSVEVVQTADIRGS